MLLASTNNVRLWIGICRTNEVDVVSIIITMASSADWRWRQWQWPRVTFEISKPPWKCGGNYSWLITLCIYIRLPPIIATLGWMCRILAYKNLKQTQQLNRGRSDVAIGCTLIDLSLSTSIALENPRNQTWSLRRTTTPKVRLWENMSQSNSGTRRRGKVKRISVLLMKSSRNVGSRWCNCLNSTCTPPI